MICFKNVGKNWILFDPLCRKKVCKGVRSRIIGVIKYFDVKLNSILLPSMSLHTRLYRNERGAELGYFVL